MRDSGDSPHPPAQLAQGAAKAQETVELRVLPGPQAPWRRLWDWLLAPVPTAGEGTQSQDQPEAATSAGEGDRP
ncbi:MAG: hypothetical protein Q8P59_00365 [Dehalococcoidia bacterium]|nr:hypothetical protein [Dehalococcoidia bacterium]